MKSSWVLCWFFKNTIHGLLKTCFVESNLTAVSRTREIWRFVLLITNPLLNFKTSSHWNQITVGVMENHSKIISEATVIEAMISMDRWTSSVQGLIPQRQLSAKMIITETLTQTNSCHTAKSVLWMLVSALCKPKRKRKLK